MVRVMLTRVGGNAAVGQEHAVRGCRNGCICVAWLWGTGWLIRRCVGVGCWRVCCRCWVQVLMEKSWYLPRCCGCGRKDTVCSLVHCVCVCIRLAWSC